ncbi:MAG TPA: patatin-like phospholipase family protein [Candidatus Thermoplasmatota archaeon]|nr:patatin-like phospholipase family protein [Candidatus Thermoplasmatota archaeon]
MKGLVLSGGGGRGAYEYGVYSALADRGIAFDVISGTSVGAITAAFIASGVEHARIEALWRAMGAFRVAQPRSDVWTLPRWTNLLDTRPLRRFLEDNLDLEAVRTSPTQLRFTAVDVDTGELTVFRNRDVTIDHLLASSAIPILFPMVEVDGRHYWDGGAVANTPIGPAIEAGATEIYTVLLSPMASKPLTPPENLWEAITRLSELRMLGNLKEDIKQAKAVNRIIARGFADPNWRHVDFHVISPSDGLGLLTMLNFSPTKAAHLISRGREDGLAYLGRGEQESALEEVADAEQREDMRARRGRV